MNRVVLVNFGELAARQFADQVHDSCGFAALPLEELAEELRVHRIPQSVACVAISAVSVDEARAALERMRAATDLPVLLRGSRELIERTMESDLLFEGVLPESMSTAGLRSRLLAMARLAEARSLAIESQRLAEIGALVASVSHELTNPLSYVRSNVGMALYDLGALRKSFPDGDDSALEELVQMLKDAQSGVERVVAIVRDLRDMARHGKREPVPTALSACAESAWTLLKSALPENVKVVVDTPPVPPVLAEPGRIIQVALNLLSNAVHACSPEGGTVTLRTERRGKNGVLEVVDDGPGMDSDTLERAFDPFFTTKPPGQGTGLGLSISRQFVREFGGELRVVSAPGRGTRCTVELPFVIGR